MSYSKTKFKGYLEPKSNNILNLNKYIHKEILKTPSIHHPPFKESKKKQQKHSQNILKCNIAQKRKPKTHNYHQKKNI